MGLQGSPGLHAVSRFGGRRQKSRSRGISSADTVSMPMLRRPRERSRLNYLRPFVVALIGALVVATSIAPTALGAGDASPPASASVATSLPRVRLLSQEQYFNSLAYI